MGTVIPTRPTPLAARTDADFDQEFVRFEDEAKTQPLDLAGYTFRFVVKAAPRDEDALLEATIGEGVVVLDEGGGRIAVQFDKTELAEIMPSDRDRFEACYALQAASPAGADEVWAAGPFMLTIGLA